jgi:hypothetical protein
MSIRRFLLLTTNCVEIALIPFSLGFFKQGEGSFSVHLV